MKRSPVLALVLCIGASLPSYAQRGTNWPTHSGDPQRTGWQRNETKITRENIKDFQLLWKGGEPKNFELKLEIKLEGPGLNSGIQYRSTIAPPPQGTGA